MDEHYKLEEFKQELLDIYKICGDAVLYTLDAWKGEASLEYINHLREATEVVLDIVNQAESLQNKIIEFKG